FTALEKPLGRCRVGLVATAGVTLVDSDGRPAPMKVMGGEEDTFATRLAEDGASTTEIQALLGHESLNTSQGYIDATANATRQAARANRTYRALERLSPHPANDSADRSGDETLQGLIP